MDDGDAMFPKHDSALYLVLDFTVVARMKFWQWEVGIGTLYQKKKRISLVLKWGKLVILTCINNSILNGDFVSRSHFLEPIPHSMSNITRCRHSPQNAVFFKVHGGFIDYDAVFGAMTNEEIAMTIPIPFDGVSVLGSEWKRTFESDVLARAVADRF